MKIGVIVLATGKYQRYVRDLHDSIMKNFLPGNERTVLCLTDAAELVPRSPETRLLPVAREKWPGPTLHRYHGISGYDREIGCRGFDFVFHIDADMLVAKPIGEEILGTTVGTISPVGYDWPPGNRPYCRDPRSLAYVAPGQEGPHYFTGALNGGTPDEFLEMARGIAMSIDMDASDGVAVPLLHEESYLNRHYIDNPPEVVLTPEYCCPNKATLEPDYHRRLILTLDHPDLDDLKRRP